MIDLREKARENLRLVREKSPLVHNITNFVVMNYTANVLLSLGAAPVMAHAENEVEEMVAMAGALVLNIGTLTDDWTASMIKAAKRAGELGVPVVLDPVGAGATRLRTETAARILAETKVSLVRGNASEIMALGGSAGATRGVDSVHTVDEAEKEVVAAAEKLGVPLVVTGERDLITDGGRVLRVENGHPLMSRVTGMGCAATAVIGAFLAVDGDPVTAAATALAYYGLAGEIAAEGAGGPGSFQVAMIDALYGITPERLGEQARVSAHKA